MSNEVIAALIGASVSVVIFIFAELVSPFVKRWFAHKETRISSYEQYAYPLASVTANLLFRLQEILVSERAEFLRTSAARTSYNTYKYCSTVYRLCAFLGWVRVLKLERSLLIRSEISADTNIQKAIGSIERAFADGPHVELEVLTKLSGLWRLSLPQDSAALDRLAAKLDARLHHEVGTVSKGDEIRFSSIPKQERIKIIETACKFISDSARCEMPSKQVLVETIAQATAILDVVQTWIYRDWQSAIGDCMLGDSYSVGQRYSVMGYAGFESEFVKGNRWFKEVEEIIKDLDPTTKKTSDYRPEQLRKIMLSCAELIRALDDLNLSNRPVSDDAVNTANRLLKI